MGRLVAYSCVAALTAGDALTSSGGTADISGLSAASARPLCNRRQAFKRHSWAARMIWEAGLAIATETQKIRGRVGCGRGEITAKIKSKPVLDLVRVGARTTDHQNHPHPPHAALDGGSHVKIKSPVFVRKVA